MAEPASPAPAPAVSAPPLSSPPQSPSPSPSPSPPPPPPPEREFESRDELLTFVRSFTVAHGYAVVINKSNVPRGQVWLRCDLGGSQRAAAAVASSLGHARRRRRASRRQECPFQLYARRLPSARWSLRVLDARHNHGAAAAAEQLAAHPVARRLTLEQKLLVQELTDRGARPAAILERLRVRFPGKPVKVQDIYNARNHIRRERNAGREPFARPDGWSTADALGSGGATPSSTRAEAGDDAPVSAERLNVDQRLQNALRRIARELPRWTDQRQERFVARLEQLLSECAQAEAARGGAEGGGGDEDAALLVEGAALLDDRSRASPSPLEQATELLLARTASPRPSLSPSSLPPPSSELPFPDKGEAERALEATQPSISL